MNFKASFLSQFVLLVVLFLVGISSANAQTSFKQSDDAVLILRSEINSIRANALQTNSPASATYKYSEAKVGVLRTIAEAITAGATTEAAIGATFKYGAIAADMIGAENGYSDKADAAQVRKDVELALKN